MKIIVQEGNPFLRTHALEVPTTDITKTKVRNVIKNMKEALAEERDGVAIAAPQIGISLRIFVVSGKVFDQEPIIGDITFINPEIINVSKQKALLEEGCLSVRNIYGKVERAKQATVRAYDESGTPFTTGSSGLIAQIFQHETDHLNGILFIDTAQDLEEIDIRKEASKN